jgi:hypothetical protein
MVGSSLCWEVVVMVQASRIWSKYARISRYFAVITIASLSTLPEAHAGLLDFLFGRPAGPPPSFADSVPTPAGGDRRMPNFRRKNTAHHQSVARPKQALCCKEGEDAMLALMNDPTLRKGDAVMMTRGVMIFEGSNGDPSHQSDDFVALAKAASLSSKERGRILAVSSNSAAAKETETSSLGVAADASQKLAGK